MANHSDRLLCAANFSEGRRPEVVKKISEAAAAHAAVLDVHVDADHHRAVITLTGTSGDLTAAVVSAGLQAAALVDLRSHTGIHPRFGAVDVVPFVPLGETSMLQAIAQARDCAGQLWKKAAIPCFLYEAASESKVTLPDVRRQAFKELKPDFGSVPHPTAGAAAVGARHLLVAFNVNIDSQNIQAARRIAALLRREMADVRALGFELRRKGVVQVSCNLLRPSITTMADVFHEVRKHCKQEGLEILETELVGLAPDGAMGNATPQELMLTKEPKLFSAFSLVNRIITL